MDADSSSSSLPPLLVLKRRLLVGAPRSRASTGEHPCGGAALVPQQGVSRVASELNQPSNRENEKVPVAEAQPALAHPNAERKVPSYKLIIQYIDRWVWRVFALRVHVERCVLALIIFSLILPPESGAFGVLTTSGELFLRVVGYAGFLPVPYLLSRLAGRPLTTRQLLWISGFWLIACQCLRGKLSTPLLLGPPLLIPTILVGKADLLIVAIALFLWIRFREIRERDVNGDVDTADPVGGRSDTGAIAAEVRLEHASEVMKGDIK